MTAVVQAATNGPLAGVPVAAAGGADGQPRISADERSGGHERAIHVHAERRAVAYTRQVVPMTQEPIGIGSKVKALDDTRGRERLVRVARDICKVDADAVVWP